MYFAIFAKIFHILHFYTKHPFRAVLTDECDGIFHADFQYNYGKKT